MKVLHSISACREPSDVVINSIMDALMPLFDDNVSDKLRRTLTRDPILIQCNENCSKEGNESSDMCQLYVNYLSVLAI